MATGRAAPGEGRGASALESARLKFLKGQLEVFEETTRLEWFLSQLPPQQQTSQTRPSRLQALVHWTEQRLQALRRQCSAVGMQKALAESRLFGPRTKAPGDVGRRWGLNRFP